MAPVGWFLQCTPFLIVLFLIGVHGQIYPIQYQIRLVDGFQNNIGRVEVYYRTQWHTVCDTSWGLLEASTVCRQLGYSGDNVRLRYGSFFGQGSGPSLLVNCYDSYPTLESCSLFTTYSCSDFNDAGVECDYLTTPFPFGQLSTTTTDTLIRADDDIRLVNGPSPTEGRVELWHNNQWNTICDDNFGIAEAQVVCRQLGYDTNDVTVRQYAYYGSGIGPILHADCVGWENRLDFCILDSASYSCYHFKDVGVRCGPSVTTSYPYPWPWHTTTTAIAPTVDRGIYNVRLADGASPNEGRVEIWYNGQWNTLCSDSSFDDDVAQVVCRQLGYPSTGASRSSGYGQGSGTRQHVQCFGWEYTLDQCTLVPEDYLQCSAPQDVAVSCDLTNPTTIPPFRGFTSHRVIGTLSFLGISLTFVAIMAVVLVVFVFRHQKPATPATLSTITATSGPDPGPVPAYTAAPATTPVYPDVPV